MQNSELINKLRECSHVERAHTIPHHGSYTNGQHSFDAVILLLTLNPGASMNLIKAVLVHDFGERWCGDIPGPAKRSDPVLKERSELLEQRCLKMIGHEYPLTEEEKMWLKAVDKIEILLWAKEQQAMGNRNVAGVMRSNEEFFAGDDIPQAARDFVKMHRWSRTHCGIPKE